MYESSNNDVLAFTVDGLWHAVLYFVRGLGRVQVILTRIRILCTVIENTKNIPSNFIFIFLPTWTKIKSSGYRIYMHNISFYMLISSPVRGVCYSKQKTRFSD